MLAECIESDIMLKLVAYIYKANRILIFDQDIKALFKE